MRRMFNILPILALSLSLSGLAAANPALDAQGKCRDNGRFVEARLCKVAAPAVRCRDIKTKKFAKCGAPGVETAPVK